MNKLSGLTFVTLAFVSALGATAPAAAQVAGGTTTIDTAVFASTQIAMGWSVKKTLLGKTIFNETGQKVGKVQDLIIAPDRNVSYVIVGAGGFVGIGRHDVAIPVTQIQDRSGKLVMAGATKEMLKGMPQFTYATDTARRDAFVAAADRDITQGKAAVASLEKKASEAAADAKTRIGVDITALQADIKAAEGKLSSMKQASVVRWKEFEADVNAATARLRKSTEKSMG